MKKLMIAAVGIVFVSGLAAKEKCSVLRQGASGLEWGTEDCKEHPIPCSREWTDEKGTWHSVEVPCAPGKQKTREQVERDEARAYAAKQKPIKDKCGADYRQPKVGMTLARAQECVAKFAMTSQINRADGVVSTYSGRGMYLHVMGDKVIAWGKY